MEISNVVEEIRRLNDSVKQRAREIDKLQARQTVEKRRLTKLNTQLHNPKSAPRAAKPAKNGQKYIRLSVHPIEEVFSLMGRGRIEFPDGTSVNTDSKRYVLFKEKGCQCVSCGLNGTFFAKEKDAFTDGNSYHFNLYGIDLNGREVLMTKDHVKPRSRGGTNDLANLEPMCQPCNGKKGNQWESGCSLTQPLLPPLLFSGDSQPS